MKIAIMQPYFMPYLGYFQLLNYVDKFVFYDNVNFIKGGWINRNKIGNGQYLTIPLKGASSFKKINEIEVDWNSIAIRKLYKTIKTVYNSAPFYNDFMPIVEHLFEEKPATISELAMQSVIMTAKYLGIKIEYKVASKENYLRVENKSLNLINICKIEEAQNYINPIGGVELYNKEFFLEHGIKLNFIKGMPSNSILELCMLNDRNQILEDLKVYEIF